MLPCWLFSSYIDVQIMNACRCIIEEIKNGCHAIKTLPTAAADVDAKNNSWKLFSSVILVGDCKSAH